MPVSQNPPIQPLRTMLLDLQRYHLFFLVMFAVATRIGAFFHLDTVTLGWRQADLSSIAMNYLNNGFRFFYPQIDWGGTGPGYVEMEFPIIPYLTALLYKVFGVHDVCALIIPFLSGIGVVIATYTLTQRVCDSAGAFIAALFVGASPLLSLASQTYLSEPPLILCTLLSMYFLVRWTETSRTRDYLLSVLCTTLAVLIKLTALYIGLPLLILFVVKYGRETLKRLPFWMFGVLSLVPVALWYSHSHSLYVDYGNTFGILAGGYNKFARAELLFHPDFYFLIAKRILLSVSTPLVFLLFLYALFQAPSRKFAFVFHAWVVALVIYTLLIAEGNKDMIYYQLPWLPVLSILGSVGFFSLLERIGRLSPSRGRQLFATVIVCGLVAFSAVGVAARSMRVPITFIDNEARIRTHAEEVRKATPEGSLIVVATSYGNEKTPETIDTPPQMFYFSKRHGWYLALAWVTPEAIRNLKALGADYLVVFGREIENFRSNTLLYQHLVLKYHPIIDHDDLLMLQLSDE